MKLALLPTYVREALQEAARIDPKIPAGDSYRRTRAIEVVIARARLRYPHLFKPE